VRGVFLSLLILIFLHQIGFAISLDCNDPDIVFCMDMAEGQGLTVLDRSKTGATGTLNGGPAWVNASAAWPNFDNPVTNPILSTYTYTLSPPHFLQFTATLGEDVTTGNTSVGDFSGNKPGMIAVIWKQTTETAGSNAGVFNWGDGATGGWRFETSGGGGYPNAAFFGITGVTTLAFHERAPGQGAPIPDRRPHSYGVWFDGSGVYLLFIDGVLTGTFSRDDFVASAGSTQFSFAKSIGGPTEWAGGVWGARVWNKAVPRNQAESFFKAYHDSFFVQGTND